MIKQDIRITLRLASDDSGKLILTGHAAIPGPCATRDENGKLILGSKKTGIDGENPDTAAFAVRLARQSFPELDLPAIDAGLLTIDQIMLLHAEHANIEAGMLRAREALERHLTESRDKLAELDTLNRTLAGRVNDLQFERDSLRADRDALRTELDARPTDAPPTLTDAAPPSTPHGEIPPL
jgi:hypothetical protein